MAVQALTPSPHCKTVTQGQSCALLFDTGCAAWAWKMPLSATVVHVCMPLIVATELHGCQHAVLRCAASSPAHPACIKSQGHGTSRLAIRLPCTPSHCSISRFLSSRAMATVSSSTTQLRAVQHPAAQGTCRSAIKVHLRQCEQRQTLQHPAAARPAARQLRRTACQAAGFSQSGDGKDDAAKLPNSREESVRPSWLVAATAAAALPGGRNQVHLPMPTCLPTP